MTVTLAQKKKLYRYAAVAGVVLGVICKSLPHDYQAPCELLANLCSGGF